MNPEDQACHDLKSVKEFRSELRKGRPITAQGFDITASQQQVEAERERVSYAIRQNSIISSLVTYQPLYRNRVELMRPGDTFRIFFSPVGAEFVPVDSGDGDDVLVSWAHPRFLHIRDVQLGHTVKLGKHQWTLVSRTELGREELGVLFDLLVKAADSDEFRFAQVHFDGDLAVAIPFAPPSDLVVTPVPPEIEYAEKTRLVLDTVVKGKDGKSIEIPFALDEHQWSALSRFAADGTIALIGPPGTGKTTVAMLRATTLIHSIYEHDDNGQRVSDIATVDLRKDRFRVIVVTEHLRNYLKEFLSSPQLGLPEAQVVNLRGAFLENFVRHKTLTTWINGVRFRLSKRGNALSDALIYIKSLPETLRLCFFHAVLNAQENAGDNCRSVIERIHDRIYRELERDTLERVLTPGERNLLREKEVDANFDLDDFLKSQKKDKAFADNISPRHSEVRRGLAELRDFLVVWLKKANAREMESIDSSQEVWLRPGADDLLLANFVEAVQSIDSQSRVGGLFIRETWRELVHLVDPKEVLLRVIDEFSRSEDIKSLEKAGLDREGAVAALNEWKGTLDGLAETAVDEEDEVGTIEELPFDEFEPELQRRRGAFTRSDFPLLASLARVFLAMPPNAKSDPEKYRRTGFLLPDDLHRYDHVIIDEGQDFTYAEIHLVSSLVEPTRNAVTVSGDPRQRMDWRSGFASLETIGISEERRFLITRNYRQTIELSDWVNNLSRALFGGDGLDIQSTHEHGPPPKISVKSQWPEILKAASADFVDWYGNDRNPFTALLFIGVDAGMRTRFTNSLSNALEAHSIHVERVEDGRMIERGRVSVADVPTVKGLEFDAVVVVVGKDACEQLSGLSPPSAIVRNMLYVASSRARRNLTVLLQADVVLLQKSAIY